MSRARNRLVAVAPVTLIAAVAIGARPAITPGSTPTAATPATDGAAAARAAATAAADSVYAHFPAHAPAAPVHLPSLSLTTPAPTIPPSSTNPTPWRVGFAKEVIDPSAADLHSGNFHLGGYGILPTRASTGPLVDGDGTVEHLYVSAMAINQGKGTLLLGALENQGTFAAYKQGPYGISDIRREVSNKTGVPVDMIVVNSDHSHAGPDLIGLWGGVPVDYLKHVHDQAVKALVEAWQNEQPASLLVGTSTPTMPDPATGGYIPGTATPGEDLVHSQFGQDTQTGYPDQNVDTQLRVLQAVDASGHPLGTLINYAAHATVMGGGNLRYSADWPGRVARATEAALGEPVAVPMVADVGRSQPPRPHSNPDCSKPGQPTCDVDQLDTYTRLLTPWVLDAVGAATPVTGSGVKGSEKLVREAVTNPALLGVSYTGEVPVRGYGAYRSVTPPYFAGDEVGTFASAHRVGNVLLTASPGEAYPDVRFGVDNEVSGMQATFTFGLANDQLGYLIAPTTEYGWITTSNVGNDNSFFNVAPQFGDHLMCTQTALAEKLGFAATGDAAPYGPDAPAPNCAAITATDKLPEGPAPQQPWPFGDGKKLPKPFPQ